MVFFLPRAERGERNPRREFVSFCPRGFISSLSLTLLERSLHILDGVLGDLELDGVRSQETGDTVNQERINLSLTGLGLSRQVDLVH